MVFMFFDTPEESKKHIFAYSLQPSYCCVHIVLFPLGDWSNAASHLELSAVAIASQFGEESIELGRQLFKLAQLHFNG